MSALSWPELVVLMAYGDGSEDRLAGTLISREVEPVEDDYQPDPGSDEVLVDAKSGRVRVVESAGRLWRRGSSLRRERMDGQPFAIVHGDTRWVWLDGADVPTRFDRASSSWNFGELSERWPTSRWEGDDFTRLTGPITATEFLGRRAWAFELAPPRRKPYPLQLIVDAASGLILRHGNAGFGSYTEWSALELGLELPDELFTWTGPELAPPDYRAQHEADMTRRRAWLSARGIGDITIRAPVETMLHNWDDETGYLHASLNLFLGATLVRRPASAEAWAEVDQFHYPHVYRWSDVRWDWALGSDRAFPDDQLAALQAQLATRADPPR